LFSISTIGIFRRPVIAVGPVAVKIARNKMGRACNKYEADLYRNTTPTRRAMLCPVLWVSWGGFVLVMRAAVPLAEVMSLDDYLQAAEEWGAMQGEDSCPFEPKPSDWGWYDGRRVALDYSAPAWGEE
jgi:hypothetical protein